MKISNLKKALIIAALIIIALNLYMTITLSLSTSKVEFLASLKLFSLLTLGPFSWVYLLEKDSFYKPDFWFLIYTFIALLPWYIFKKTKGIISFSLGVIFWFLFGFLYVVAIWV